MKKIVISLLTVISIASATLSPANAWYRGGYYGGGWGYGGGYGAALGIGLGLGVLGAIAGGGYGYGGYYGGYYPYGGYYSCVPRPIYNAWGQTVGYAAC